VLHIYIYIYDISSLRVNNRLWRIQRVYLQCKWVFSTPCSNVWTINVSTQVEPCFFRKNKMSQHMSSFYNYENEQQDALYRLIYYSKSTLHVSGEVFAHHREHLTVFTVSGSVHPSCCRLVSWMSWNWTMWTVRRVYTKTSPETCIANLE